MELVHFIPVRELKVIVITNRRYLSNAILPWLRIRELPLLIFVLVMIAVLTYGSQAFMQSTNFHSRARVFSIEGITLIALTVKIKPMTPEMEKDIPNPARFLPPTPGYGEVLLYYELAADTQGQWKRRSQGHYVLECVPSNCQVDRLNLEWARGSLQILECREYRLESGVLNWAQEKDRAVHEVRQLEGT